MKRKAAEKKRRLLFTDDGIPRDPNALLRQDWADINRALTWLKRRIAKRHKGERK